MSGACVVFVDIDPGIYNIDVTQIEEKIIPFGDKVKEYFKTLPK